MAAAWLTHTNNHESYCFTSEDIYPLVFMIFQVSAKR